MLKISCGSVIILGHPRHHHHHHLHHCHLEIAVYHHKQSLKESEEKQGWIEAPLYFLDYADFQRQ